MDYISYLCGLNVDADGSPRAYHPNDSLGLDFKANGGQPGNWWGIWAVNNVPVIQFSGPYTGYYISMTSLVKPGEADGTIARYVNAETVPYIAMPSGLGASLGDLAFVYNTDNKQYSYAIFADTKIGDIGEGSIKLAENLKIGNTSPKNGGVGSGILYIVFTNSKKVSTSGWRTTSEVQADAAVLYSKAGFYYETSN